MRMCHYIMDWNITGIGLLCILCMAMPIYIHWMVIHSWLYPVTWGSSCGNIHRHCWSTPRLVDSSDDHRVSSFRDQVMECV